MKWFILSAMGGLLTILTTCQLNPAQTNEVTSSIYHLTSPPIQSDTPSLFPAGCPPTCNGVNWNGRDLQDIDLRLADLRQADLRQANLNGADLRQADLRGANLTGASLIGADLYGADLRQTRLVQTDFRGAELRHINLWGVNLKGLQLKVDQTTRFDYKWYVVWASLAGLTQGWNLRGADLAGANLNGADLNKADLTGANFNQASLAAATLHGATLHAANLAGVNLARADLSEANLQAANLNGADLSQAKLSKANLYSTKLRETNLSAAQMHLIDLTEAHANKANLSRVNLSLADCRGTDLSGANLSQANLNQANLYEANLSQADLRGADLRWAILHNSITDSRTQWDAKGQLVWKLVNRQVQQVNLRGADLSQTILSHSDLHGLDLSGADLSDSDLHETNLRNSNLSGANLNHTILRYSNLKAANLNQTDLTTVNLDGVSLDKASLREVNLSQVNLEHADLPGVDLAGANLRGAHLYAANLYEANLDGADLQGADLRYAELRGADLIQINLREVQLDATTRIAPEWRLLWEIINQGAGGRDLRTAYLRQADLARIDLHGADLSQADLRGANLSGANLNGADLSQANLAGAILTGADLTNARLPPDWSGLKTSNVLKRSGPPSLTPTVLPAVTAIPVTSTLSFRVEPFTPRLIDDENERIYTIGYVAGSDQAQTLVLNLADERLLTTYDLGGGLALDTKNDRLYIDQYRNAGLAVLNTRTGQLEQTITLPGEDLLWFSFPQADPTTGWVLAFRDNLVYIADPVNGTIVDTVAFEVLNYLEEIAPIERPLYDPATRLLYLTFTIHGCTSTMSGDCSTRKLVVYDLAARQEIACDDSHVGTILGHYMYCARDGWVPIWGDSRPWFDPVNGGEQESRVDFDPNRQRFYEVTPTQLKVYEARRLTLTLALPRPISGTFERYEAKTDALQFRVNGQLQNWPVSAIQPPAPEPLTISPVPTTPVQVLAVSPGWPADPTLLGTWLDPGSSGDYNRLFSCNSLFYISRDAGQTWGQSQGGLAGSCGLHWPTLAVSPDFVHDQTLFAGVSDMGILKSSDGGQWWRPSGVSLPDRYTRKILLSPGFATDKTVLAMSSFYSYRSTDRGSTWQILNSPAAVQPGQWQDLALSAEFEQDQTILGSVYDTQTERARLFISKDGGDQWPEVGELPEGATTLSLAPLFTTRQTVFAYGPNNLYRSTDGGQHWQPVLTLQDGWLKQLIYAPNIEQNRPVFVLSALTDRTMSRSVESNRLYRSNDGGLTWQPFDLPVGVIPTAIAISPHFERDRTLFIGTADGQVLTVAVAE